MLEAHEIRIITKTSIHINTQPSTVGFEAQVCWHIQSRSFNLDWMIIFNYAISMHSVQRWSLKGRCLRVPAWLLAGFWSTTNRSIYQSSITSVYINHLHLFDSHNNLHFLFSWFCKICIFFFIWSDVISGIVSRILRSSCSYPNWRICLFLWFLWREWMTRFALFYSLPWMTRMHYVKEFNVLTESQKGGFSFAP